MRVRFGEFVFDGERRELSRRGTAVHLSPKAFELLAVLLQNAPRAIRKEEIYESIWPDTIVEPANLNNLVSELRAALDDREREIVQTRPRFGYAFAAVTERDDTPSRYRMFRLILGERVFELNPGRNLIGREDDCSVVIDSPEISRYHAVIDVEGEEATVEDLDSRNGTFVGGEPVRVRRRLEDHDEIGLGRTMLRFRSLGRKATTVSAETRPPRERQ